MGSDEILSASQSCRAAEERGTLTIGRMRKILYVTSQALQRTMSTLPQNNFCARTTNHMCSRVHAFGTKTIHIGVEGSKIPSETRGELDVLRGCLCAIAFFLR